MRVTHLSLTNFRNYRRLELDLAAGPVLLHGRNAQGKTNLLEALFYLATTRSPLADNDQQLLSWDAAEAGELVAVGRLVAHLEARDGHREVELRLIKEGSSLNGNGSFRREALVNRRKVRLMDLLGTLRAILFLPEDIQLITGPPAHRRRFVDVTLCQIDPGYCRSLSTYNKLLEQRNAVLRQLAETGEGHDVLPIFTEKLAALAGTLFARRAAFFVHVAREAGRIHYEQLTDRQETIRLNYLPSLEEARPGRSREDADGLVALQELDEWLRAGAAEDAIAERYLAALRDNRDQDLARGSTTLGPHRDDWFFQVDGRPLGSYGSRGQQRSAVLALKLAEIHWMEAQTGETPVLLLDEVVAELDERRRELVLDVARRADQAILTATDPGMFTRAFLAQAQRLHVTDGRLERETTQLDPV